MAARRVPRLIPAAAARSVPKPDAAAAARRVTCGNGEAGDPSSKSNSTIQAAKQRFGKNLRVSDSRLWEGCGQQDSITGVRSRLLGAGWLSRGGGDASGWMGWFWCLGGGGPGGTLGSSGKTYRRCCAGRIQSLWGPSPAVLLPKWYAAKPKRHGAEPILLVCARRRGAGS